MGGIEASSLRLARACGAHRGGAGLRVSSGSKAGRELGECGVLRQALGIANTSLRDPVGKSCLTAMRPGRGVLLPDRREPLDREAVRGADQGTPDPPVDERLFPFTSLVLAT